ncbi:MAG: Putative 2-acylglycerophosphoethanolamine acyltransferase / acyl-acyl carrier protein synthetase (EC [uncultured Sulfurovum sp.]|uniref:2-acylglycerophosphoethanolamine acyltransferase / acyl-acyl carrier protein synthetase (EC) n=1 Tax=uncultured Sulfurovum sp. TaxID=269237 RepID=A0A6S6RVG4_9BACT|nr:MAG: Putative 2-acylglycerophosphoethanolamine acyltransferase / acyl-acyl carrier protein synthetase (EC [uncultured Sulfurovum sp.]
MKNLFNITGFTPYIFIVFLNAMTDLGHKIVLQNTILKAYDGSELIILTAIVNALILLPFILLFSPAGFLSDKYAKVKIIRVAALFAVGITSLILFSYIMGWFWVAFGLTFVLAAQSAIYSPAKYGLIKEMVGKKQLTAGNSVVQSVTIVAILAGGIVYSIFFEQLLAGDIKDKGEILQAVYPLGFALILASIVEFLFALKLSKHYNTQKSMEFKVRKYADLTYLRGNLKLLQKSKTVWLSIIGLSIFWGISQLVVATFGAHVKSGLGIDNTVIINGLLALSGLGMVVGSLLVSRFSKRFIEVGLIPFGAIGVSLALFLIPSLSSLYTLGFVFFLYGIFAGLFIVPLNTIIQLLTPKRMMGKVLAGNNFMQYVFMFSFLVLTTIFAYATFSSSSLFVLVAVMAFLGFLYTLKHLAHEFVQFLVRFVFGLFYNIEVQGLENLKAKKGVLLLGNHVSFLDWAFLQIATPRPIRFVIDRHYYELWYFKPIFKFFKAIPISTRGGKNALKAVGEALNNGDMVALFPEGHLTRNGHIGKFQKGFELAVAEVENAVIVPFYLRGLWEGKFSHAEDKVKAKALRDVTVSFGTAMSIKSRAVDVKEEVLKLSTFSWKAYIERTESLPKLWIKEAKKVGSKLSIADSTGVELSGYKFITAVLLMRKKFKKLFGVEQNVGLIIPTAAGGSIANMATLTLGKTIVNLNYSAGTQSLKHAIELAEIKQIVTSTQFMTKLKAKGFDLTEALEGVELLYLEEIKKSISKAEQLGVFVQAKFLPSCLLSELYVKAVLNTDTAAILFSSGSEGIPKGIELSHQNIVGNIKQFMNVLNPKESDVMLGTLPIFHSFGITVTTFAPLIERIPVICHPDPTDGLGIAKLSHKYNATFLFATATFFRLYARNKKIHPKMFENLRMVIAGAEKLPKEINQLFKERFGKEIWEGYGATETAPAASCNVHDAIVPSTYHVQVGVKHGSIGLPLPGTAIKIVDPESFDDLERGEDGMILIGGVQVMKGYLKNETKTQEVIKELDGIRWYVTGDKGHVDEDGFLTIVDRYSRFAKIGGEMISLGLVEAEIGKLMGEEDNFAITAIPDEKKGEKIVLLLEGEKAIDTLKEEIKALGMNPLFVPTNYFKVDEVPKLGTGKADFKGAKKLALGLLK